MPQRFVDHKIFENKDRDPFLSLPIPVVDTTWMAGLANEEVQSWFEFRMQDSQDALHQILSRQGDPRQALLLQREVFVLEEQSKEWPRIRSSLTSNSSTESTRCSTSPSGWGIPNLDAITLERHTSNSSASATIDRQTDNGNYIASANINGQLVQGTFIPLRSPPPPQFIPGNQFMPHYGCGVPHVHGQHCAPTAYGIPEQISYKPYEHGDIPSPSGAPSPPRAYMPGFAYPPPAPATPSSQTSSVLAVEYAMTPASSVSNRPQSQYPHFSVGQYRGAPSSVGTPSSAGSRHPSTTRSHTGGYSY